MVNNVQTPMKAFFPDGRIYEYFLQRLRLVAGQQTPVLSVHDIRDVQDTGTDPPCIEVVLRIVGFKIQNPVTEKPMISTDWIRKHFEGQPSQKAFLDAFAAYLAALIPADHPEANLKAKFMEYRDGAPGDLPARADLYVEHQELVRQLRAAQKWLRERKSYQGFRKEDEAKFLRAASHPAFWWAKYVKEGQVTLDMISSKSPQHNAKHILALKYDKSYETIRLRLSRREV